MTLPRLLPLLCVATLLSGCAGPRENQAAAPAAAARPAAPAAAATPPPQVAAAQPRASGKPEIRYYEISDA